MRRSLSFLTSTVAALSALIAAPASAQEREEAPPPPPTEPAPAPIREPAGAPRELGKPELAKNSVFAEGLGAAIFYSINYERIIAPDIGVRVGFGYLGLGSSVSTSSGSSSSKASYISIPVTIEYLGVRSRKSALELGAGFTAVYTSAAVSSLGANASGSGVTPFIVGVLGYRLHPLEDQPGFHFRVGITALGAKGMAYSSGDPDKFGFILWPHLSFGGAF